MLASPPSPPAADPIVLKFPPFPAAIPQLGELVSFKDFQPAGLYPPYETEDDDSDSDGEEPSSASKEQRENVELDGAGVPTVDIHVNHDPNRHIVKGYRRKATKQGILRVDDLFGINGHEPTETRGGIPYDPIIHPLTRVYRATKEWEVSRKFALGHTYNNIWTHWKRYAEVSRPVEKKVIPEPEEEEEDEDDELLEDEDGYIVHPEPEFISPDEGAECRFLSSIVDTVRMWLSSEFKDAGLAWLDAQLVGAPLVTRSFLLYLLAHGVLPERVAELNEAVKICELAEKDMLATKEVSVALEDGFNKICSRFWGTSFEQEQNHGWSTPAPNQDAPSNDLNGDVQPAITSTAEDVGDLHLEDDDDDSESDANVPPVVVVAESAAEAIPSPPSDSDEPAGSGWDIDPADAALTLSFAPPLAADSPSTGTPTTEPAADPLAYDDGGWGVSPSLLVDPKAALFPSTALQARSIAFLSGPEEAYSPAGDELSLRRVVATPSSSLEMFPQLANHELVRSGKALGPLVLERWEPMPQPFVDHIAVAPISAKGAPPPHAYLGGEKELMVVWVDQEAVKDTLRAGMGIFAKYVWVERRSDGGGNAEAGGFWFVDAVQDVIAEYWLAPKQLE